ncbi:MAG TPA: fibronectin type III domain-containing protein [Longimicrobiales bacterium]|nr:fibronectin type III domain-containing protein [Longimicrobiales bacterium]
MKFNRSHAQWGAVLLSAAVFAACDDDDPPTGGGDAPETPTGLATSLDVYDLTVSWTAAAGATTYDVALDDGDAETTDPIQTGVTGTSVTFERVAGGAEYDVAVVARNTSGPSDPATTTVTTPGLNRTFFDTDGYNNLLADPGFAASAFNAGTQGSPPDFTVAAMPTGYTAASIPTGFDANLIEPLDGRTLDDTDYAGAVEPGTALADAWYYGWTVWAADGSDSRTDYDALNEVVVDGDILADATWTSDNVYRLDGPVFVGVDCGTDGMAAGCTEVTLTIEPGTTIIGETDVADGERGSYLVVSRGSQLIADAYGGGDVTGPPAEEDVIVFTSENIIDGTAARSDWGGLIINGMAPTNAGDEAEGEGDSGFYGGTDEDDSSGIIRGVRIEFAGDDVTSTDQLNGIALQGVGAGTTISYIQVHYNEDDGIEPFGGTVSVDHAVFTGIGDDSVDGTDGYRGFMQYIIIQQRGDNADQGLELSNNGDTPDASPQSTAIVANVTAIGAGNNVVTGDIAGAESDNGIQLREGTNYRFFNSILTGFGESGFCIRDSQSIVNALNKLEGETDPTTTLRSEGLIVWNNQAADDSDENFAGCGGGSS